MTTDAITAMMIDVAVEETMTIVTEVTTAVTETMIVIAETTNVNIVQVVQEVDKEVLMNTKFWNMSVSIRVKNRGRAVIC